ncbi:MAG: MoxR family ATPase [Chloroflexi bacterium]|nr:MoxR family ATPase [Chloroflexota bacterium]
MASTFRPSTPNDQVARRGDFVAPVIHEIKRVIVGQEHLVNRLLLGLLCDGHLLVEGLPGLAKSLAVKTLADTVDATFKRVQFTPDLLPADLVGTLVYNPADHTFRPQLGPIFTDVLLADEINRAPAKVQSALLEAMQERQVSIGGTTYPLSPLFMVLATQNPIEHEGTYRLPEAQVDRFMLKVLIGYPSREEELVIMDRQNAATPPSVQRIATPEQILAGRAAVRSIHMDERLRDYVVRIVVATREPEHHGLAELKPLIAYGASPRASIFTGLAARAHAFLDGRDYVLPDDIKSVAPDVMRHRLIVSYQAEAEEITAESILSRVLDRVPVP